ncbi:vacuolar protein sorting-associated protein 13B-like, partial [Limulus polyphemus]|uniref:Vacuolar protein sorting-associated protein 13B-like n=1 Tax=Limulus polyphemus TaxID=6850 RepID=A0ABM1RZR2_LIMPO
EQFSLGIQWLGELYTSKPLHLSQDDWSVPKYWPKVEGRVPLVGHTPVFIQIVTEEELKICPLCITSRIHDGMRIITVNAAWSVNNQSETDLLMITNMVASSCTQVKLFSKKQKPKPLKLKAAPENSRLQPVLFWDLTSPGSHDSEYQQYLCLAQKSSDEPVWSYPVCVTTSIPDSRLTVSVPEIGGTTKPYLIMVHKKDGLTFLITKNDPCPVVKLYNNTKYILLYGQSCFTKEEGYFVEEEKTGHKQFLSIGPGCSAHYTPPALSSSYPNSPDLLPNICLAKQVENTDQQCELVEVWSCGINLMSEGDQFVNVPDACDVRIHKERVSNTIVLFIEPANRVEISAKEIRSRIGVPHGTHHERSVSVPEDNREAKFVAQEDKDSVQPTLVNPLRVPAVERTIQFLSLKLSHMSLIICDDLNAHQPYQQSEVLRVNLDQLLIFLRPGASEAVTSSPSCCSQIIQEVKFHVGSIQVDNQLEEQGASGYDFPVILLPSGNDPTTKENLQHEIEPNSSQSLLKVDVVLEYSEENRSRGMSVHSLSMSLTPVSVYLEDTFFYKLFKLLPTFKPSLIHRKILLQSREQLLPAEVSVTATSLSKPIHIHQFHIHPISLMLSLRASLKLYLSLDHTPLHFHSFQRNALFSSSYRLGHMLTMHYLSAALLRAGWVLGSMDLLANPAGFARAVSRGLTDFVLMPYRGLLRGPWAFVTGMSDGAASMLRQITSGALVSVTNWAGSVSRNMDRLSMDTDHWTRQETLRRHHPSGLVAGLAQGLSGFGISLL